MAEAGITADQCRIGRAAVGWSEGDLASAAGVPERLVTALEAGGLVASAVSEKMFAAFAGAGVSFFDGPDGSARMRARTLDGIIETPVTMSSRR